ncbi:MAG: hypothetical protein MR522_07990 [Trueperella sp.]|uniref:site-specific DNA-methyltransferase n=1 Tax=Trueperella sp. TaxID=2699835 RepID=UPI0025D0A9AE|nr:DNA methyltransferase [Trueperella sp.]MCI7306183.1 hypothetical protein [Trueperella sp.]
MSRLTDLMEQLHASNPQLGADLEGEIRALTKRRNFGLVFERHQPEAVELPGITPKRGSKVRILPPRGALKKPDNRLWLVQSITNEDGVNTAQLAEIYAETPEHTETSIDDLVVVAEFQDGIFPGLVETGRVERGGEKPFHTVINAENFHALEMLTYTHRGKVDAIYIDPPYNTGAKDWKYNNNYVEADDAYRHSKWLAMMERRLLIAKELLNPDDSVLICTIDEKEYLRLGLLLEQCFPEARIQMVSVNIMPSGVARSSFSRTDEYYFFVMLGSSEPSAISLPEQWIQGQQKRQTGVRWESLLRSGNDSRRVDRPNLAYPILLDSEDGSLQGFGDPLPLNVPFDDYIAPDGLVAVFPRSSGGGEARWRVSADKIKELILEGAFKVGSFKGEATTFSYLKPGELAKVHDGTYKIEGRDKFGTLILSSDGMIQPYIPGSQWNVSSHDAGGSGGTGALRALIPQRRFPFPKSLYAVEDSLRFFVKGKPNAVILDFFSGSGTTAHAVMRLNKQDGGQRQCISVTNNEVSADEQKKLRKRGLRPGDPEWEALGICDYITKPRIKAAITGLTPDGDPIKGAYKFTDEFPMADGLEENAAFFTLTYESPLSVRHHRAFERVAPMLWLRAGAQGRIIADLGERGWDVSDVYGVLENFNNSAEFFTALSEAPGTRMVFFVTDDDAVFQMACRKLSEDVEPVRLYSSYLQNFEINRGRA